MGEPHERSPDHVPLRRRVAPKLDFVNDRQPDSGGRPELHDLRRRRDRALNRRAGLPGTACGVSGTNSPRGTVAKPGRSRQHANVVGDHVRSPASAPRADSSGMEIGCCRDHSAPTTWARGTKKGGVAMMFFRRLDRH